MFLFQEHAVKYIREMVGMIREVDQNFAINLVYYVKVIGEPYPEELEKYKEVFEGKYSKNRIDTVVIYHIFYLSIYLQPYLTFHKITF